MEKAFIELVSELKTGAILGEIYDKIYSIFTQDGKTESFLKDHLSLNFGYGTGFKHQDLTYSISENNKRAIQVGQAFFVQIYLKNLKTTGGNTYCLIIADTVMITSHGPQNITSGVSKDFKDISYTLDDENEEEGSEEEMKDTA